MPTYDYQCDACDHTFELYQGINDAKKKKCPACGKLKLRRLLGTGAAVVFKGSGFYQTDYRSESYHKAKAADKPSDGKASEGKGGESKSSEAKSSGGEGKASVSETSAKSSKSDGASSSGKSSGSRAKSD